ncbi:DnaE-like error-prone DNA polymerase [Rhizobium sp. PP-F2F-G48]|uniref:error-prone DNA polymerase n=1 Tax=Rhizobium sp. PP-F2F-G48 TaxID=2135651 RepID=UPI00104B677E|nr:error-prone DNA polymerase [Rhizobium sp. PP-F2F-G48]TCM54923.1 DnaE-like error-prone DNA polymerase [Rhizobium sp. PP-F2F-G48]
MTREPARGPVGAGERPPKAPPPAFFELGACTNFSFLRGASGAKEMVVTAKRTGLKGLGIADLNTLSGVVRVHAEAKEEKFPFQPGARLVFADGSPDMLAYPRNRQGWAHLCRLLSAGNLRADDKGTCTLFLSDLLAWQEHLQVIVMKGRAGESASAEALHAGMTNVQGMRSDQLDGGGTDVRPDDTSRASDDWTMLGEALRTLQPRMKNRLFLGMTPRYDGFDAQDFAALAALADRTDVRLIATNDVLYHAPDSRPLADVMTAIREHVTIAQAGFRLQANAERFLKTPGEMARIFRRYPQAVANTERFFRTLDFTLDELKHNYPDEAGPGETSAQTLERLVREGAARRYPHGVSEAVETKIAYELDLIRKKQYEPYFLTVHRLVTFARSKGILCQGRGSAANSSVCYCLHVTEVDPVKFTLLFDRFLSMDRDEPPDIDIDFEHARREEVIQFIYDTYTKEHSGIAAAAISYRARSAGREVAKVFGFSEDVQTALAASIWGWWTSSFTDEQAKAAGLDLTDPTVMRMFTYAGRLMDMPRHLSQHVGGFVITKDRLDEVVPIMPTAMPGRYMIEWNKDDLDTLKILKVDVLALGMLTCLAKAFRMLETHYGKQMLLSQVYDTEHDYGNDDNPVYDMICRADTVGVFQIESRAQMSMLPRLRPRAFYDLVIEVAIVRPGPIQGDMVHPYLKRREAKLRGEAIPYESLELKAVLQRTLGVPLFQEQAMQIAMTAARFTAAEADQLRRAMATFRRSGLVANFETKMIEGMVDNGYSRDFAVRCFNQIKGFGEYGFPESHAASFALLVYASCWFKTFYPDIFCAALLNAQPMGFYAPAQLVRDAREHGVQIRAVDINLSGWETILEGDGPHGSNDRSAARPDFDPRSIDPRHRDMRTVILTQYAVRLGFRLVKGLREGDMARLVANRGEGYVSIYDLWLRSGLTRSVLERLADADAFGSIGIGRRRALWEIKALDEKAPAERLPLFAAAGEVDLRADPAMRLPTMPAGEEVVNDYRALSLSLKAHPVSFMREAFARDGVVASRGLGSLRPGRRVTVAGLVLVRQRPGSAKGVIFMTLEDETGVANIIVWKAVFETFRAVVMGARLVKVTGRLQSQNGVIHVVAERLEDMTEALGLLKGEARRFAVNERADEVLRPTVDQRQKGNARDQALREQARREARLKSGLMDTAQVMPKGRNFH